MVHPLGDYACQPSDSTIVAHALTSGYYLNGQLIRMVQHRLLQTQ